MDIQDERCSKSYRYAVAKGVRQVTMLSRHAPSHLTVGGHRVLLSYERQPATRYGCGEVGCIRDVQHVKNRERWCSTWQISRTHPLLPLATHRGPSAGHQSGIGHIADIENAKFAISALHMPAEFMDTNVAQAMAPT
jgi:hypothetical protein